jgi:cell division protein FtsZ
MPPPQTRAPAAAEKQRFSVNTLLGRMTGHGEQPAAAPARRQQPPVQAHRPSPVHDQDADAEDDRIEIPAFLRRQAN